MKTFSHHTSISRCSKWATALSAITISLLACTASAKDEVPIQETWTSHTISLANNPDGSQDSVSVVVGVGPHVGRFTGSEQIHVEPPNPSQYDPGTHSLLIPFTVSGTRSAANRDTWSFTVEGVVIVPLDANFMPLPLPYAWHATWENTGGTGRFVGQTGHGTSSGISYADGTGSGTAIGVVSTVGSNKK